MSTSALAWATRVGACGASASDTRTWLTTAPPFWARPVASSVETNLPSKCAAVPSSCETVTTPVPPTPAMRTFAASGPSGKGKRARRASKFLAGARLGRAPRKVTIAGQNPARQEMSLLQAVWLIARFTPSSVGSGSMAAQLDCTEQSPQPSHTASLITTRTSGSVASPRRRRRRSSAAQVWS